MKHVSIFSITLLALALLMGAQATSAIAKDKSKEKVYVTGTVESIDVKGMTFIVMNTEKAKTMIKVTPETEFELEHGKHFFGDDDVPFSDLKVGDWVKVKAYHSTNEKDMAKKVKIYREIKK